MAEPCPGTFRHELETFKNVSGSEGVDITSVCNECGRSIARTSGDLDEGYLINSEFEFAHNAGLTYEEYLGINVHDNCESYSDEEYAHIQIRIDRAEAAGFVNPLRRVDE